MAEKYIPTIEEIKASILYNKFVSHPMLPVSEQEWLDGLCHACLHLGARLSPTGDPYSGEGEVKLFKKSVNSALTWNTSPEPYPDNWWRDIFKKVEVTFEYDPDD